MTTHSEHTGKIAVDLDIHAFIFNEAQGRVVDVTINGLLKPPLVFTTEDNRKTVTLAAETTATSRDLEITFLPRDVAAPNHVMQDHVDTRPLSIALHQMRLRRL